jgi:hypothetical protein
MIRNQRASVEGRQPRRLCCRGCGERHQFFGRLGALVDGEELRHLVHHGAVPKRRPAKIIGRHSSINVPSKIISVSLDDALSVYGEALVRLVHLKCGDGSSPVVGIAKAPRCRLDRDPAAPDRLMIRCCWSHTRLVV